VEIRDAADDVDRPLWETGEEPVLASAQCILLATRSDLDSEVEIEVHVGAGVDDPVAGQLLFDGEAAHHGQGIMSQLADQRAPRWAADRLASDPHPCRPPRNPARFTVLLELRPASGYPLAAFVLELGEQARSRRRLESAVGLQALLVETRIRVPRIPSGLPGPEMGRTTVADGAVW